MTRKSANLGATSIDRTCSAICLQVTLEASSSIIFVANAQVKETPSFHMHFQVTQFNVAFRRFIRAGFRHLDK